jgi:hypothetical protein
VHRGEQPSDLALLMADRDHVGQQRRVGSRLASSPAGCGDGVCGNDTASSGVEVGTTARRPTHVLGVESQQEVPDVARRETRAQSDRSTSELRARAPNLAGVVIGDGPTDRVVHHLKRPVVGSATRPGDRSRDCVDVNVARHGDRNDLSARAAAAYYDPRSVRVPLIPVGRTATKPLSP